MDHGFSSLLSEPDELRTYGKYYKQLAKESYFDCKTQQKLKCWRVKILVVVTKILGITRSQIIFHKAKPPHEKSKKVLNVVDAM
jgi:hypothetical protein